MGASASQLHTNRMANDLVDSSESFDRVSGKRCSLPAILNAEKSNVPVEDLRNTLFDSKSVSNYESNEISVESATYSDHIIKSQEFSRPNSPLVQNTLNALKANMSNPNLNVIKNVSISKEFWTKNSFFAFQLHVHRMQQQLVPICLPRYNVVAFKIDLRPVKRTVIRHCTNSLPT